MRARLGALVMIVAVLTALSAHASTDPSVGEFLTEGAFGLLGGAAGAAAGVLVAGDILDIDTRPLACLSGGLLGGLVAAFAEPILYLLGVPDAVAEFLGFALLPILPAVGATVGLNLALHR